MDGMPGNGMWDALRTKVKNFFFEEEVPYGLALMRIMLPLVMLIPMLQRLPRVRELFSADGATCQLSTVYKWGDMLPEVPGNMAIGLYVLMIFCLFCTSLGWMTRISVCIGTVLYTYFNLLDAVSTLTKYSVIATDAMLVMCVANSGAIWSVDSWLANRRRANHWPGEPAIERPRFPVWQARLVQLLVAFTYFGAAITKMQTTAFFSGDQMRFWMLTNLNFNNPFGEYAAFMPGLLVASAYMAVIWETCFIFTVWRGWQRPVMLLAGVGFHFGTTLLLGLFIFPLICTSVYLSFVRESDVRVMAAFYRRTRRRFGWRPRRYTNASLESQPLPFIPSALRMPPLVAFVAIAGVVTLLGIEIEYRSDLYGTRSGSEPVALKELDRETAQRMLTASAPLREQDKFFSFDIGTTAISGILMDAKDTYTYGDTILAQGSLNPPHEDLLVECDLRDSEDRIVHHFQTYATREMFRCDFHYFVGNDTPPGKYSLVLKSSGVEVGRRSFNLVGTPPTGRVLGN